VIDRRDDEIDRREDELLGLIRVRAVKMLLFAGAGFGTWHSSCVPTEVQLLSFVGSIQGKGSKPRLWNIQNLGAVPPYAYSDQVMRYGRNC